VWRKSKGFTKPTTDLLKALRHQTRLFDKFQCGAVRGWSEEPRPLVLHGLHVLHGIRESFGVKEGFHHEEHEGHEEGVQHLFNRAIEVHRVLAAGLLENGIGFTLEYLCQSG